MARAFRVTLVTGDGQRIVLPCFLAASQQKVHDSLDRTFPDRTYTSVMVRRQADPLSNSPKKGPPC